jgi:hypothetical protein
MKITGNSSLKAFQDLNNTIYKKVNDQCYNSARSLFSRLHCHVIQIIKGARKENYGEMEYHLCMALSWSFALANSFHIDIENAMWERFPGRCPYCGENRCKCKERALYRQKVIGLPPLGSKPDSLFRWQKMFRGIYFNEILPSALHLAEETGE